MGELSFLICTDSEAGASSIRAGLESSGHARVESVVEADALSEELRARDVDALFVELGADPEQVLEVLQQLPPPRPLLLMSGPQEDSRLLLRAMRLGAKEFFPPQLDESEIRASVERLILDGGAPAERAVREAPILAVIGAKGGVGATTVACQLAAVLQRHAPTAVVDLDLRSGDVALYFDVVPSYTVADLRGESEALDATFLRTLLQPHATNLRILAAPDRIEDVDAVETPNLERAVRILSGEFSWLVLDVSRSWSEVSLRALDLADQILLVTSLDVPSVNHTRKQMELFRRLGCAQKVRLIANRQGSRDAVTPREFARFLEQEPDAFLPGDFATAAASIEQGKPIGEIARDTPLDRSYHALGARVHEWCGIPWRPIRRRRFDRLFQRLHGNGWLPRLKGGRHVPA